MNFTHLHRGMPNYPDRLTAFLGDQAPSVITTRGDLEVLWHIGAAKKGPSVALFCSIRCPEDLMLKSCDLSAGLRDNGVTVVGGFHSPTEKECLRRLLSGTQPIIICPPRGLQRLRIPAEWQGALDEGRLLLLSPFEEKQRRASVESALRRNQLVAALADETVIVHAAPKSKTEQFCLELVKWEKPLWTLESPANDNLIRLGARIIDPGNVAFRSTGFARGSGNV
jgi:predicted Rossmann fold nucleotide-binding protein DprA/Smf involved in DNA uptake